jgi:transcriptional regulator with GAF, ATPase, and Fis domain
MDTERLAETFVSLADTLVDDFDVLDLLHVLTTRCVDLLDADAVGLMLADSEGELRITVASNESARLLDLFQLQNDEGPCLECFRSGQPVGAERLADARQRWPRFTPAAEAVGFTAVLALPLRLRGQIIGALNLFGGSGAPISEAATPVAQALADVATIAILQDRLARDRNLLAEQLQTALNSRVAIEQAKGALSNQFDIGTDEAFDRLRHRARSTNRRLVEVAEQVVTQGVDTSWQSPGRGAVQEPSRPAE